MFQSFEVTARPEQGPPRLKEIRSQLNTAGLDGYLIPRADAHQGEYVSAHDERLAWLTGFTGSAGFCAVLKNIAGVFVDGRYRTQVKLQVATEYSPVSWPEISLANWLMEQLPEGGRIGFDPWLHTPKQIAEINNDLENSKILLTQYDNLVDRIWKDQPLPASEAVKAHPIEFAGENHSSKRSRLGDILRANGFASAVITLPDSLCWLLNIRGADIPRNPIAQGFAVLHQNGAVDLFMDPNKLIQVYAHLGPEVTCHKIGSFLSYLETLKGPVCIDKSSVPVRVADVLGNRGGWGVDPCALPKACKNIAEIEGSAEAHLRDGAAVVELLAWLDSKEPNTLREIQVATQLEHMRRRDNSLQDISFETIAGTGPNGAIMHYRVTEETDSVLQDGQLIVLDSGGQYLDGTTDITRTISIGLPPSEACAAFTRVLMGMIAISRLRWPKGLAGRDIEAIGRAPLWYAHQDFDHGLGHGVGAYLSVHEGPQRLSRASQVPIEPGMILSNEPGYYREGEFGIRIENLIVAKEASTLPGGDEHRQMLQWRTLTYVPMDKRLILSNMLDADSKAWINNYHAETLNKIGPRVSKSAYDWLKLATKPL